MEKKKKGEVALGFSSYGKAISLIFTKGLWWFFIFPLIFNITLYYTGFEIKGMIADYIEHFLFDITGLEGSDFFLSEYVKGAVSWGLTIVLALVMFFILAYFGGYVVLIIMSPILAYLSEKTEKIVTGNEYPFSAEQLMRDIVRGVLIASRNVGIEFGLLLAFFILSFIPVIGWFLGFVSSIILFFISSYFYGFSFMDYSSERQRLNISQSVKTIRKHKWLAVTNGGIFALSLLIPFCGVSLAGFFAIISVVAASISMTEVFKDENKQKAIEN